MSDTCLRPSRAHAAGRAAGSPPVGPERADPTPRDEFSPLRSEPGSGAGRSAPLPASHQPPRTDAERAALYAAFQPLVQRLIRQYGDDPELRQDLEGEIYWRFCQLVAQYEPARGVPLRAYLVRTLPPAIYTYARSQWRQHRRENRLDATVEEALSCQAVDPTRQWDERLAMADLLQLLPKAIATLPLRQRQVVIWRYYESRSFEEIAELLEVRPATARSLLRHALNTLRRQVPIGELQE